MKKTTRIEAHGVKGMKNTKCRKIFTSKESMMAWVERNQAEIYAVSEEIEEKEAYVEHK